MEADAPGLLKESARPMTLGDETLAACTAMRRGACCERWLATLFEWAACGGVGMCLGQGSQCLHWGAKARAVLAKNYIARERPLDEVACRIQSGAWE